MQRFSIARTMNTKTGSAAAVLEEEEEQEEERCKTLLCSDRRHGNSPVLVEYYLLRNSGKDQDQHTCINVLSTSFMISQREDLQKKSTSLPKTRASKKKWGI